MSGKRQRLTAKSEFEGAILENDVGQGLGEQDLLLTRWAQDEAARFFEAFQKHNTDWEKVSRAIPDKSPTACEALYRKFRSFLSLPKSLLNVTAFLAVVKDSLEIKESEDETVSEDSYDSKPGSGRQERLQSHRGRFAASSANRRRSSSEYKGTAMSHTRGDELGQAWGSVRQRGQQPAAKSPSTRRQQPARAVHTKTSPGSQTTEADDALGIDALLSLAAVAQEASNEQEISERDDGRPVRSYRSSRRRADMTDSDGLGAKATFADEQPLYSPPSRKRSSSGRQVRSPPTDPLPPRTPSSRIRRQQQTKRRASSRPLSSRSSPLQRSPGLLSRLKRGRRQGPEERSLPGPPSEADLEAEKEDLEEEVEEEGYEHYTNVSAGGAEEEDSEHYGHHSEPLPRRRRRKAAPERAPPMMASARSIYARRSSISLSAMPPAFLLGVPPPSAQINATETEGQTHMGLAETRLRRCLDPRVRRYCAYEFFYSAIDRPFFMQNELTEYLEHVGIPQGTKLMRPEMAIIRASLGSPRRLSLSFLRQERIKLEAWRQRVREVYAKPGSNVPSELPRQLQVGQKVTARHPVTRQLHDGDVLTVAASSARVQFERRELGVELVKDIDVMPCDPVECLPVALLQSTPQVVVNGRQLGRVAQQPEQTLQSPVIQPWALADIRPSQQEESIPNVPSSINTLADMKAALDTKESLLTELKQMNDEVDAGLHKETNGQRPEAFQKAYAQVLVDLQKMNKLLDASSFSKQLPGGSLPATQGLEQSQGLPQPLPAISSQAGQTTATLLALPQEAAPKFGSDNESWESLWQEGADIVETSQADSEGPSKTDDKHLPVPLVIGCICMLLVLQQRSQYPQPPAALEGLFSQALLAIRPKSHKNMNLFKGIEEEAAVLKALLQPGPSLT